MIKQDRAVYNAVVSFYRDSNKFFEDGNKVELTQDERKTIVQIISQGLQNGSIKMSESAKKKHDTPKKIHNYATGLVSDRLRKDKRLNGNVKHTVENPGSRIPARFADDKILIDLKEYKKKYCFTAQQKAEANNGIKNRIAELRAEELKDVDMSVVNKYVNKS